MKVFFDTNILLDVLIERQPFYEDSAHAWSLAHEGRIDGYISALTYPNIHYVVRKTAGTRKAGEVLRVIRGTFHVVALDEQILHAAMAGNLPDFEDAIQMFSALQCAADCILTRDAGHFGKSSIPTLAPAGFLARYLQ